MTGSQGGGVARQNASAFSRWWLLYTVIAIVLGWALRDLRTDDPFITYRFADNLAQGRGFVFNPGDANPALITTAPLYALYLAGWRLLGLPTPVVSLVTSVVAILVGACALEALGRRRDQALAGGLAGLVYVLFPLLWLTVGFETAMVLALALSALWAADAGRLRFSGVLAGLTIGLRGDGFLVAGLIGGLIVMRHLNARPNAQASTLLRQLMDFAVPAVLVYSPVAIGLTWLFGSPLPTTLTTKSAQALSGLTGFYPGTHYLEGALLLGRAYVTLTPIWWAALIGLAAGMIALATQPRSWEQGLALPALWSVLHALGYTILGVSPYVWYYAPLIPGLAALAAIGIASGWQREQPRATRTLLIRAATGIAAVGLVFASLQGDAAMARLLWPDASGRAFSPPPPPPEAVESKVLPEAKVRVYTEVGHWLREHTPPTATLGVTELGAMSYWADRHTVDFLGLVQPDHLGDIRHGDFLETLFREQPDYLALTDVNAFYNVDPTDEAWFAQLYHPIATFDDEAFWGSPMTVWQRNAAALAATTTLTVQSASLGDGWQVEESSVSDTSLRAGQLVLVRIRLRAGDDVGTKSLSLQAVRLDGAFASPVASRTVYTHLWRPGETAWVTVPLIAASDLGPGGYDLVARWEGSDVAATVGRVKAPLPPVTPTGEWAPLSGGTSAQVWAEPLRWCRGDALTVPLAWQAGGPIVPDQTAFVHVRDAQGGIVAQADGQPVNGLYPTGLWSAGDVIADVRTLPADKQPANGTYDLVIGLYDSAGARFPIDDGPRRTPDGGLRLGEIRVENCSAP